MDMVIQKEELRDWFKDYPHCNEFLKQGYQEAISDMTDNILSDPRSSRNTHVVNNEFVNQPAYFMGFEALPEQHLFILSCIYVFPEYRKQGLGTHLINTAKALVKDQGAIQVAVEEEKLPSLNRYYKKHGFITTGTLRKNLLNKGYIDYFWSAKNIELKDIQYGTAVKPID